MKLVPEPKANVSLLIPFEHLEACIQAVPEVLACGCEPTAVEFMEREVIACAETYLGKQFPDASSDAYCWCGWTGQARGAPPDGGPVDGCGAGAWGAQDVAGGYGRAQGEHLERVAHFWRRSRGSTPQHG